MNRKLIKAADFQIKAHSLWHCQNMVLTSGDFNNGDYNCMTVGWGSIGTMWTKPFVQVVVRPTRYTHEFMEKCTTFTVCAFGKEYYQDVQLLGSRSGRDGNKLKMTKLTPIASKIVSAPGYAEAELIIECGKIYKDIFKPENFIDVSIHDKYPLKDYHTIYFGWIEVIYGTEKYCAKPE